MTSVWHKHRNIRQFGDDANDAPVRPRDTESSVSPVESSRVEFRKMSPCHKLVSCCCPPSPCTFSMLWWLRVRCLLACYSYIHNTKANGTWQPSQHHFLRHSVSLARSLSLSLSVCVCVNCARCMCVCVIYSYADCRDNARVCVCVCAAEDTQQRKREWAGERKKVRCTANGSEALQATGKADVNLKILRNWIKVKIL